MHAHRFPALAAAARDGRILADNAAGAQLPDVALGALERFIAHANAQKGSIFARPEATSDTVARAKATFAELIGVDAARVGVGLNATTIAALFSRLLAPEIKAGMRVIVTAADHYANVVPWSWLARFGAIIDVIPVDALGDLDMNAYAAALERRPFLVALPWASNATGTRFELGPMAAAAKGAGALVVVDGVQAAPHMPIEIDSAFDLVTFSGYKIFAPHIGFWCVSSDLSARLERDDDPMLPSAPFAWTVETGTQNHEGLAGWLGTVDYLRDIGAGDLRAAMAAIEREERTLVAHAAAHFIARSDQLRLYGRPPSQPRLPVFAFNVEGVSSHDLAVHLDRSGIEARVGDYYSPRLLRAIAPERDGIAVRMSFAHYNTTQEIDRCFEAIDQAAPTKIAR